MSLLPILFCLAHLTTPALSSPNLSKFNQPAALGAYKDIIDTASSSPISVLGKTWKKFTYADYQLPAKPVQGAYQDIINAVEDPKAVLGSRTFETKSVGYACRDAFGATKFCRLMEDDGAD